MRFCGALVCLFCVLSIWVKDLGLVRVSRNLNTQSIRSFKYLVCVCSLYEYHGYQAFTVVDCF